MWSRDSEAIKIDLFAPVIGSEADQIALVCYYVIEFVVAEEAAKRRV